MLIRLLLVSLFFITTAHASHSQSYRPVQTQTGPEEWTLQQDFRVRINGYNVIIPTGFSYDGASAPLGWLIAPMGGHYPTAALLHDYFYSNLNDGTPHPAAPDRKDADRIFLQVMQQHQVKPLVRVFMWLAVRWFGGAAWIKELVVE